MPIPLAPNTTPTDASGAFALLAIIGDEGKYKKRLQELQDQAKEIEKMIDNSRKLDADSKKRLADVEKLKADLDVREGALKRREEGVGNAHRETQALQQHLNERTNKFDEEMEARAKVKEAGLTKWAAELTEKEKVLTQALRDFEAEQKNFKARIAAEEHKWSSLANGYARQETAIKDGLADLAAKEAAFDAKVKKLDELRRSISNAA